MTFFLLTTAPTRAQTETIWTLGLTRPLAVGGSSMGSFQTVEWGINFPDARDGLIMIVPAARGDHHFAAIAGAFQTMLTLDPKYQAQNIRPKISGRKIH